jgi:hypothetical protein
MSHDDGQQDAFTDGRAVGSGAWAARSEAGGEGRPPTSRAGAGGGERPGLGGLWLLLVPLACCGGPLLIAALAAAGALAWGALGLGAGVLVAVAALVIGRRRRGRACCKPGVTGCAGEARAAASRRGAAG